MSTVTEVISSCSNCKKVRSLAEQLIVNMQAFEVLTMEMELDPKSAKSKSRQVISKFWELILMVKSSTIVEKEEEETGKDLDENQKSLLFNEEEHEGKIENEEYENKQVKSNRVYTKKRKQKKQQLKLNPIPITTERRLAETEKANKFLRTIKYETPQGFYNLFECTKCQRQFNDVGNGRRHVKNLHLHLGTPCPTCGQRLFNENTLELHIPKCRKRKQLKQIKISVKNNRKIPVKVVLHPQETPKQGSQPKNPIRKFQDQLEKRKTRFGHLKIKGKDPFPNFNEETTTRNVKVGTEGLNIEKSQEILSVSKTSKRKKI